MAYRACCTSCGASLRRPGLTVSADGKACRRGTHLLDDARSAFPLPGQDVCEEGLHDSGEIARNAFGLLNKVIAQREIDRRLARCTGAATLRSHTFGDGQCALLGGPIDTSRNNTSAVSHPMAGMESFRLRPQGQLLGGTCEISSPSPTGPAARCPEPQRRTRRVHRRQRSGPVEARSPRPSVILRGPRRSARDYHAMSIPFYL